VLDVERRWRVPKDKDEPDYLQRLYFFKTKCYLFVIVPPCLPELKTALLVSIYGFVGQ